MTQAWMKRSSERQALFESLMRQVYDADEEKNDPHFLFRFAKTGLSYLQQRRRNIPRHDMQDTEELFYKFRTQITEFARSPAEEDEMVAQLTVKVLEAALQHFHSELSKDESEHPEIIFHAPTATSEVPLEG